MSQQKSLYEPKLVELWNERYRQFELDEATRNLDQRLRQVRRKLREVAKSKTERSREKRQPAA